MLICKAYGKCQKQLKRSPETRVADFTCNWKRRLSLNELPDLQGWTWHALGRRPWHLQVWTNTLAVKPPLSWIPHKPDKRRHSPLTAHVELEDCWSLLQKTTKFVGCWGGSQAPPWSLAQNPPPEGDQLHQVPKTATKSKTPKAMRLPTLTLLKSKYPLTDCTASLL